MTEASVSKQTDAMMYELHCKESFEALTREVGEAKKVGTENAEAIALLTGKVTNGLTRYVESMDKRLWGLLTLGLVQLLAFVGIIVAGMV